MSNKEQEKEAKGVDSVTDYVEEREDSKLQEGLSSLAASNQNVASIAAVQISQADIQLVCEELELSREMADALLRKNGGVVKDALLSYVRGC